MIRRTRSVPAVLAAALVGFGGCAHFNTFYNAERKYDEAMEIRRRADPEREKITTQEEQLYKDAFERAARVVKYWPDSKWVDDALLLMGRASFEKGDYSTALRKFDEILVLYPNSGLVGEALLMKGRTLYQTKDYPAAVEALNRAAEQGGGRWRGDVLHHLGLVRKQEGDVDGALAAFGEVVSKHGGSEWYGLSALEAGDLERDRGNAAAAVELYEKVRSGGRTAEERYLGGMRKGEALVKSGDIARAQRTFADVAKGAANDERRGKAVLAEASAVAGSNNVDAAVALYQKIVETYARQEAAAEAQFAIAALHDSSGNLALAKEEYERVKDQGTGHDAWQRASQRIVEIEKVMSLREKVAAGGAERDSSRFLLAEHLLEKLGDVDGALAEYATLSDEAKGSEWGAKALFAQAWLLENRMKRPQAADSVFFRLANGYAGGEIDSVARQRLGYPVWKTEQVVPPKVTFIRPEGESSTPQEVLVERVEPKPVPLPAGVTEVQVWVRVRLARDGAVQDTKVVKSGGVGFDEACLEAARASRFVGPDDGGPEVTVLEYAFPPRSATTPQEAPAKANAVSPLRAAGAGSFGRASPADSLSRANSSSAPSDSVAHFPSSSAPPDSASPGPGAASPPNVSAPPERVDVPAPSPDSVDVPAPSPDSVDVPAPPPGTDEIIPPIRDRQLDRNP